MTERKNSATNLLYIIGAGHCGSTLLDMCLDAHPSIMALGEIVALRSSDDYPSDSAIWRAARDGFGAQSGKELETVPFAPAHREISVLIGDRSPPADWLADNRLALEQIAVASSTRYLSDSSKEWQRLHALSHVPGIEIKVIHLVRDARGVMASYKRKYGNWSRGYRRMMKSDLSALFLKKFRIASGDWHTVRYEDLATDPARILENICKFLELPFDENMLAPQPGKYEGIGGNRMRKKPFGGFSLNEAWRVGQSKSQRALLYLATITHNLRHRYSVF